MIKQTQFTRSFIHTAANRCNWNTGIHPNIFQIHMQCRLNACGTNREPSSHPVPLTLRKQRQSNDSPIYHWVKNLASLPLSIR